MAFAQRDDDGLETVKLLTSRDDGTSWTEHTLDAPEAPGRTLPSITADQEGTVWLSYLKPLPSKNHELWIAQVKGDENVTLHPGSRAAIGHGDPEGVLDWTPFGDHMGIAGADRGAAAVRISGDDDARDLRMTWAGQHAR